MSRPAAASLLRTRVQILLWRRGWAWPAALLLLAAAAALHGGLLQSLRTTLAATHAELARQQSTASAPRAPDEPMSEAQDLTALQAVLRNSPEPAELVRKMAALAQAQQITLQQADYQQQAHVATRLVQVHVTQPVSATYPQLRRYVESVLLALPNASLDQVFARRENIGQARLEVRLRWSFWIQKDPPGQADDSMRNVK